MPMPAQVNRVSTTHYAAVAAGTNKFITAAAQIATQPDINRGGNYMAVWQMTQISATAASCLPLFTWYDQTLGAPLTATANLLPVSADYANYGLPPTGIGGTTRGVFFVPCGSGASGVSAYFGYGISGAISGVRFDCSVFQMDHFAV